MSDFLDIALEDLALAEAEALDFGRAYRDLAVASLAKLREQQVEINRLREQHLRLLDEYRHLRETLLRRTDAA